MGDQRLELKIQEEEEDDFSKSEESKMRMILNKGWSLGKKIVITGMAISSAPIVLPPLIIFSSIGFAVAVPFGFVFVSYACTEKLMSKLLSRPLSPPSLLEYKSYEGDYLEEEDFQEDGFRGEIMDDDQEEEEEEEEEEKLREDTKETLEMRIELIGDEKEEDEGYVVELNEEKPVEDMNGVMEEEGRESLYFDNYVEEEEKPGEDVNGMMKEERADGTYFDDYVEEEEKPGEDVNGLIKEERADGTYFDNFVEEEETPAEDMNGVMEQDRTDGTYFDNDVEAEEKPVEENLRRAVMEEEVQEIVREEEKPVEVIPGEIEEEELVMRERQEVRDEENADIVIEFEEGGVKENVANIEEEKEEMRPVIETVGVVEESRDEENVIMPVVEEGKSVLGTEGEKREESDETAIPTFSSSLPRKGRKRRGKKGKKQVKETAENIEEEKRLVRDTKGGLEDSRVEEPLDKLVAMHDVEEQKAEEIGGRQNVGGMAQENYIVGKELPSPQGEIVGVIEEENVNDVTQDDDIVEEPVPVTVVDVVQVDDSVKQVVPVLDTVQEEAAPVVDVMQEDNVEEAPVVGITHVGNVEKAVPVAEISGLVEKENVNDVVEEDYIVQQVVPVVEINEVTPVTEMNGVSKEEDRDDESFGKIANNIEQVRPIKETKKGMEKNKEGSVLEKNTDNEEIPIEEVHGIVKVHEGVNSVLEPITDRMVEEEKKPIVETQKKSAPSQTENAREIADGSGLDVIDDQIADADEPNSYGSVKSLDHEADSEPHYVSLEQVSTVKEPTTQNLRKEMADSAGHTLPVEMTESKFNKEAHEQEGIIPSKEVLYSEEKIWEQIDAMRKIVGYKAALQATCIEELKALYVFIGVEPPVAFKVPSDLVEINDKLRLLMSIIGVK